MGIYHGQLLCQDGITALVNDAANKFLALRSNAPRL